MLKNDTLKNGTSRIGLYGSAPPPGEYQWVEEQNELKKSVRDFLCEWNVSVFLLKEIDIQL